MSSNSEQVRFFSQRGSRKGRHAFTLVELLVVVAIIALLVSILLPTLSKAKSATKLVLCSANLKGIGGAAFLYQAENDGYLPRDSDWSSSPPYPTYLFFAARFSPYVGGPKTDWNRENDDDYLYEIFDDIDIYKCPSFSNATPYPYVLTYISNGFNFENPQQWGSPMSRVDALTRAASDLVYLAEVNHIYIPSGHPDCPGGEAFGQYDFLGKYDSDGTLGEHNATFNEDGTPNIGRMIDYEDDRHDGKTTVAFFDGHAEVRWLTPEDMSTELFFPKPD